MILIKELMSEVLEIEIELQKIVDPNKECCCVYHFSSKCKVWAKNKGYVVGTDLDKVNVWSIKERIIVNHFEVYFEDYLEFEIKACQWILENK